MIPAVLCALALVYFFKPTKAPAPLGKPKYRGRRQLGQTPDIGPVVAFGGDFTEPRTRFGFKEITYPKAPH